MPQGLKKYKTQEGGIWHSTAIKQWQDKKLLSLLSTMRDGVGMTSTKKRSRKTGEAIMKPKPVVDYNEGMGRVEKMDQQLASYPLMCRYIEVCKIIFFYILDMAFFGSYILCKRLLKHK
jgi:hypothetical protein